MDACGWSLSLQPAHAAWRRVGLSCVLSSLSSPQAQFYRDALAAGDLTHGGECVFVGAGGARSSFKSTPSTSRVPFPAALPTSRPPDLMKKALYLLPLLSSLPRPLLSRRHRRPPRAAQVAAPRSGLLPPRPPVRDDGRRGGPAPGLRLRHRPPGPGPGRRGGGPGHRVRLPARACEERERGRLATAPAPARVLSTSSSHFSSPFSIRTIQTANTDAIAFYERLGFVNAGVVPGYYRRLRPPDAVLLERALR